MNKLMREFSDDFSLVIQAMNKAPWQAIRHSMFSIVEKLFRHIDIDQFVGARLPCDTLLTLMNLDE